MLSNRRRSRASSRAAFLLAVMSVRMETNFSIVPSAPVKGAITVSTQYTEPSFARLQTSPRQAVPLAMRCHTCGHICASCVPEFTRRWFWPSSSARL
jgi:hypothetical protein